MEKLFDIENSYNQKLLDSNIEEDTLVRNGHNMKASIFILVNPRSGRYGLDIFIMIQSISEFAFTFFI